MRDRLRSGLDGKAWQRTRIRYDCYVNKNKSSLFRKIILQGTAIAILIHFFAVCDRNQDLEKKEIIKALFEELQADLLKELQESIKKNGIASSIAVCKTISPAKERELSAKYPGLKLRRISEKNRNPEHAPNEWEAKVITDWKQFAKKGTPPYMFFESAPQELRALKPILLANETCLKCHGPTEKIDAKTRAALMQLYPDDKATGYKLGDLRGAFSATWKRL